MKKLAMWGLVLFLLIGTCRAAVDVVDAQAGALELDKLEDTAQIYTGEIELNTDTDLDTGLRAILDTGSAQVFGILRKAIRSGMLLLIIVLLCAIADGLYDGFHAGGLDAVTLVGALAVTAVCVTDVYSLIGMGRETIQNIELFSKALLPTIAAAVAASGFPGGAVARQLATMLFSDVLLTVIDRLLMPLVYVYIAACTAHAALGNDGLKRVAGLMKWVVTTVLTVLMIAFVGYLTVSGVIAGTADATTVKAAKFAVSSAVPVVGGILSDATETVLAGAGLLRNAIGVFGMLAVLAMCVTPFLQLGIHYLIYKAASALTATAAQSRVAGLIDNIGSAFGLVLGMTGACALLILISMVSAITVATG